MQRFARFAVLSSAILLFSTAAYSQGGHIPGSSEPGNIYGTVLYRSDNKPVAHAQVQIKTSAGQPVDTFFTGSDGRFATGAIPNGVYSISIEVEGYQPYRREEELLGYPGIRLDIYLTALPADKSAGPGNAVSARELGLPKEAQDALHQGTDALFQKHNAAGSLPFFQKVLTMAPDFYEAAYYQGVAYKELGRNKEAEVSLRNAAALSDDKFADADFALGSLLNDEKQYPEAEKLLRAGLVMQPEGWSGHLELARVLLATGRVAEAEQSALTARKLKPEFSKVYLLLANIHQQEHKNEAVLDDLNTYLKLFPTGAYVAQAKAMKEQTEKAMGRAPSTPNQLL